MKANQELLSRLRKYRNHPTNFAVDVFGCDLDPWQIEGLNSLRDNQKVAIAGCTGVGKDYLAAVAIFWFLSVHEYPKVICTAAKEDVLTDNLWPQLHELYRSSPLMQKLFKYELTKISARGAAEEWFAVARVAAVKKKDGAATAEGLAGRYAKHVLNLVDEASGAHDAIIDSLNGSCNTPDRKLFLIGNPLNSDSFFAKVFLNKNYQRDWKTMNVSYLDSKRTGGTPELKAIRESWKEMYGENSVNYRARALGLFPSSTSDNTVFSKVEIDKARARIVPDDKSLPLQVGVDISRFGADETVLYVRRGGCSLDMICRSKLDTVEVVNLVKETVMEYFDDLETARKNSYLVLDATGIGSGPVDQLRHEGWMVAEVHNGLRSMRPEEFGNLASELWMVDAKNAIRTCSLVHDVEGKLDEQLVRRQYDFKDTSKQRILESKKKMKARGYSSPDRADAFVLAFADVNKLNLGPADLVGTFCTV